MDEEKFEQCSGSMDEYGFVKSVKGYRERRAVVDARINLQDAKEDLADAEYEYTQARKKYNLDPIDKKSPLINLDGTKSNLVYDFETSAWVPKNLLATYTDPDIHQLRDSLGDIAYKSGIDEDTIDETRMLSGVTKTPKQKEDQWNNTMDRISREWRKKKLEGLKDGPTNELILEMMEMLLNEFRSIKKSIKK